MQLAHKLVGDVAVLELKGKLDVGQADTLVRDAIDDLAKKGCVKLVLDLGDVTHLDTTCLGLFVAAYVRLKKRGGGVTLLHTPRRIREVLSIARLDQVLVTFDSEEQAARSLAVSAGA